MNLIANPIMKVYHLASKLIQNTLHMSMKTGKLFLSAFENMLSQSEQEQENEKLSDKSKHDLLRIEQEVATFMGCELVDSIFMDVIGRVYNKTTITDHENRVAKIAEPVESSTRDNHLKELEKNEAALMGCFLVESILMNVLEESSSKDIATEKLKPNGTVHTKTKASTEKDVLAELEKTEAVRMGCAIVDLVILGIVSDEPSKLHHDAKQDKEKKSESNQISQPGEKAIIHDKHQTTTKIDKQNIKPCEGDHNIVTDELNKSKPNSWNIKEIKAAPIPDHKSDEEDDTTQVSNNTSRRKIPHINTIPKKNSIIIRSSFQIRDRSSSQETQ